MYFPVDWPVPDLVSLRARTAPDRTAMIDAERGEAWTYRELSDGPVDSLAAGIQAAGLSPGDHLGVLHEPGARLAQLVHAAARAGVVFVPLSPDAPPAILAERCRRADVAAVACGPETEEKAVTAFDGLVVTTGEQAGQASESMWDLTDDASPSSRWSRSETQWLVFTSGTVGDPKAVALTARNLIASATASAFRLGVRPDDRWLACLPMHHVGGLAPLVRSALYGTAVVTQSGFDVDGIPQAIADHAVTGISLVPTMLIRLLDAGWAPPDWLRFVLLGGAPASPELIDRCAAANVPVYPTYGATETASQVATARPSEAVEFVGTVGRPLLGIEVDANDSGGEPVPPGEPGELVVSGPVVAAGYYRQHAETRRRFVAGGFRTRDRGYLDDEGRLWVLGRVDDAIVSGGETVHPGDVEAVIRDHAAVDDVAVVGTDHAEWGQVVAALVVGAGFDDADRLSLRDHCRDRLEPHAIPKVVATADELPRTDSGTVDRTAVRERLRATSQFEAL